MIIFWLLLNYVGDCLDVFHLLTLLYLQNIYIFLVDLGADNGVWLCDQTAALI